MLFKALKLKNIETYKDNKNLEKGKNISKELIEAIEDSIFYAFSSWCLDELVKTMECQKTHTERRQDCLPYLL
ncbi:Toll/interleukin-1 receptor homology (TIR) domain-containing protein [Cynara cardunculus var. scolymus]|uniref:ADP-ribosyl cyclase/cyclic ADP-ribose hydrolase n=1 Tax=Cynara cardunculus var. scolymus TaxID=59895 RepID=A0A103Y3X4_CYNCS|nr:Toll/interleukin-1 receptor homology (TIR) domain-containing protein [Cynara cardunculus var. scolymus]